MSAPSYQPPPFDDARRQYVELFGSALVMNTYLKIALLAVSLVALGLVVLNVRTQAAGAHLKPLVIRIDDIGRAQALQYDTLTYQPQGQAPAGEQDDLEIVVVAPKIRKEVVSTEIKAEEGRRVPGTQGDTLKVVQSLPGVARAAAGSGAVVVWGAAPHDHSGRDLLPAVPACSA